MKSLKFHIILWTINYLFHCVGHFTGSPTKIYIVSLLIILYNVLVKTIVFYITLYCIIPLYLEKKQISKFILLMIFNIGGVAFVSVLMNNFLPVAEGDKSVDLTFIENYVANLIDILGVFPFVFVFWYVNRIVTQERIKIQIEQENHYLEQSIIETQLYNLKNQINPDFLFRKLNYFYHESLPYSPNLSKGISLLTDMMHYAIDDDDDNLKVSLQKEIKHIQNFVEINQLRFNGRLQVEFDIVGVEKRHEIMPLILITFVENALKYGELFDKNNPLKIRLKVEDNNLFFTTFNLTRRGPKEDSEGIGIDNTQKRLSLGYVDNYSLDIKHEPEFYEVALYIKLE
ncbi:histidine kinase [Arcicella aurantiaca]|uniref:Histidine kinase n=2 Tax=Arcicella aurantiaca TaxID=591202 RepID=A0A316EWA0_9BACT|nr:histidine kinase [Arcicella aurantiaca]